MQDRLQQVKTQRPSTRRYDNRLRLEQARANQDRIVAAARALFVEQGYLATTIADVAARASVSVPTVYKSFASKGVLAEEAYPVPDDGALDAVLTEREPRRVLERFAAVTRHEFERTGAIAAAVHLAAAAGDPELRSIAGRRDRDRARTAGQVARRIGPALRPGVSVEHARDLLWYLTAPETHRLLVDARGWSYARLERWLTESTAAALLG